MHDELDKIQLRYERIYYNLAQIAEVNNESFKGYSSIESVIEKILTEHHNDDELVGLTQETKTQIEKLRQRELEILNKLN